MTPSAAPPSVLTPPATPPSAPPTAPGGLPPGSTAATIVGPPATPSVLAPTTTGSVLAPPAPHLPGTVMAGEASFGPVSQVVRISVRTLSSRIDLVLPDRSTIAETLETVLELAPRSLREQAIAHGGWILRTAAGEAIPGSSTLLDQGVVDGATLFLTGIDAADSAVVYDDVADAIARTVLTDPSVWPAGAGRVAALGAAGLFGGLACLSLLAAGPPWVVVAVILGAIAVLGQVAAGLLSRRVGDAGVAVLAGLLSVVSGAAAATVATAGDARLLQLGAPQLLLGAAAAGLLAASAALADRHPAGRVRVHRHRHGAGFPRPGVLRDLRSLAHRRGRDRRRAGPRADAVGADRRLGAGQIRGRRAAHHCRGGAGRP